MDLSSLSPVGSEVFSVSATNSSSIFDINGNGMLSSQSSSFTLDLEPFAQCRNNASQNDFGHFATPPMSKDHRV